MGTRLALDGGRAFGRAVQLGGPFFAALTALACSDDPAPAKPEEGPLGRVCASAYEEQAEFSGSALSETAPAFPDPECDGFTCMNYHFQGRVSCPYGQTEAEIAALPATDPKRCRTVNDKGEPTGEAVTVPVDPQFVSRPPKIASYCSCECAGTDPDVDYCTCPGGMACTELGPYGSYCVKADSAFNPSMLPGPTCDKTGTDPATDCGNGRKNP